MAAPTTSREHDRSRGTDQRAPEPAGRRAHPRGLAVRRLWRRLGEHDPRPDHRRERRSRPQPRQISSSIPSHLANQSRPQIIAFEDGRRLIYWHSFDAGNDTIRGRFVHANGSLDASDFVIASLAELLLPTFTLTLLANQQVEFNYQGLSSSELRSRHPGCDRDARQPDAEQFRFHQHRYIAVRPRAAELQHGSGRRADLARQCAME